MPSLLDMTDVPMKNILEKSDYKSVLTLRKVCHSLRNFIDDTCFKTDLDNIQIIIISNYVCRSCFTGFFTGFSVSCRNSKTSSKNVIGNAKDWTWNDLKIILKVAQNSKLSRFTVIPDPDNVGGLDDLEEILKNQTRPLQTEHFEIEGSEILKVLPYLDSKTLKKISIIPENYEIDDQNLDGIEKVMELEQFKNAVELKISDCFLVRADLRKFFHFQRFSVNLHETSLEELVALKEAFVTSTHMELFDLNGRGLDEIQLENVFGTPFQDDLWPYVMVPLGHLMWFFEIQNCKEHLLRIKWIPGNLLQFRKWEAKEIPKDAVLQH